MNKITLSANGNENIRLDKFLSNHISNLSRTQIKQIILDGFVQVNESLVKPSSILEGSDIITYSIPQQDSVEDKLEPEDLDNPDEDLVIIGSGYLDIKSNFGERPSQTNGEYAELGQIVVDKLHNGDKEAALNFIYSNLSVYWFSIIINKARIEKPSKINITGPPLAKRFKLYRLINDGII